MFKAELVCFVKGQECAAYKAGEFQQLSIIGESHMSEEAALEDAYKQAFEFYGITSDEVKRTNVWRENWYAKKLEGTGFESLVSNQHGTNSKRSVMTAEERNRLRREKNAIRKAKGLKAI